MEVSIRIKDLELRSCNEFLMEGTGTFEIVQWVDDKCYTVAFFINGSIDLTFVGGRPFDTCKDTFWALAQVGFELLKEEYEEKD
jgi:hypothetical protein